MVIMELATANQNTADNIATRDSNQDYIVKRNKEKVICEENSTRAQASTIGHSWVVGSSSNGVVGINLNTNDGLQQIVGLGIGGYVVVRVVNPNNVFREHFRDTTFDDTITCEHPVAYKSGSLTIDTDLAYQEVTLA